MSVFCLAEFIIAEYSNCSLHMFHKERPYTAEKFKIKLRNQAVAAVLPLSLIHPTVDAIQQEHVKQDQQKVSIVESTYEKKSVSHEQPVTIFVPSTKIDLVSFLPNEHNKPREHKNLSHVPLYNQADRKWGRIMYGTADIASSGCAPSALAMAISYFEGRNIYPPEIAKVSLKHKWRVPHVGTDWRAIDEIPKIYGLKSERVSWKKAKKALHEGKLVIQAHKGIPDGYFTNGGHVLVLSGVSGDRFKVKDSGPRHRTIATEKQVKKTLMQSWVISE